MRSVFKIKPMKKCAECGEMFLPPNKRSTICSRKCRIDFYKKKKQYTRAANLPGICCGTVGAIAEMVAATFLMKEGYEVFRALSPSSDCDLIGIKDGVIHKYEVRTGNYNSNKEETKLSWSNKKSEGKEVLVVTFSDNKVHYIGLQIVPDGTVVKSKVEMDAKKTRLSNKQKEVIKMMRDGDILHWFGGLEPRCFFGKNKKYLISIATCTRLCALGLISRKDERSMRDTLELTDLGKIIEL